MVSANSWWSKREKRRPLERYVPIRLLDLGEDLLHLAIGLVLFVVAVIVLIQTVHDLLAARSIFPDGVIVGINDVLFVVIILEIMRTVVAHFTEGGLQLKPFLAIGIISAVRHILTVSAQLTLTSEGSETHFRHALTELGVNAAVVLALVVGLTLLDRPPAGVPRDAPSVEGPASMRAPT